jgi:hypothetical protein
MCNKKFFNIFFSHLRDNRLLYINSNKLLSYLTNKKTRNHTMYETTTFTASKKRQGGKR